MAFETTRQEITKQANDLLKLFQKTRDKKYKDEEIRLRRIVTELEAFTSGGGAQSLDDLTDVTISAPANAQVLAYNSTTSQWENQTPGGGGGGGDMNKSTYDVDNDGVVDSAERTEIIVRNSTGSTLTKGTVVYLSGATGNRPNALRAQADTEATSSKTIGIVVANINNNSDGYVATNGTLHDLDTSAFADGVAVWLSATTAGGMTSTVPAEPNHAVFIGWIARSHPTAGRIVLHIQNGYELDEIHGVLLTSQANNDLLVYESSTSLWKNKTISAIFGGTPLVSVPTLAQVTTAGNRTLNDIYIGLLGSETELSRMTQVDLSNTRNNFTVANYFSLTNGAVVYRNLSGGADVAPLVNGTTYYIQKIGGTSNSPSVGGLSYNIWTGNYPSNQVFLFDNPSFTGTPIRLTQNIPANHFFEQNNRTITNTLFANQDFQIEDGLLFVNAKQYKTGDTHWISPKARFIDSYFDDGEGSFYEVENSSERESTLLVGPYFEFNTNPIINVQGTVILRSSYSRPFVGVSYGGRNYGIIGDLTLPPAGINTGAVGGYYTGMGIKSFNTVAQGDISFGVLASGQSGQGRLNTNFTVSNTKLVTTFNNVLDDNAGRMGLNVSPGTNHLHIRQLEFIGDTIIRVDNDAANSQSVGSQMAFYRSGNANPISGASLLGKIDYYGNISGVNYGNYVFSQAASFEVRAISGAWSTTTNRSAQFMFFTRHQNTFAERMRLTSEGNLLINTTTNGTFRLDVNGTARIQNALTLGSLASDPTGSNGMIYYNTTTNKFRGFENGAWVNLI